MLLRKWILSVCISLFCQIAAAEVETLNIVLSPRLGLVTSQGTGLYMDLLRNIFPAESYNLILQYLPYNTAINFVVQQKADLTIDSLYLSGRSDVLYGENKITAEPVVAMYSKDKLLEWQGQNSLKDAAVGVFFSYDFDRRLTVPVKRTEYRVLDEALKATMKGDIPFLIDFQWDIEKSSQENFIALNAFWQQPLFEVDTYFAFANNDKGKRLKQYVDNKLEVLKNSNELGALFQNYGKELID